MRGIYMPVVQGSTVIGIFEERQRAMEAIQDLGEAGFPQDQMDMMFRTDVPVVNKVDVEIEEPTIAEEGGLLQNLRETAHELLKPILERTAAIVSPTATTPSEEQAVDAVPTETIPVEEQAVKTTPTATTTPEEQAVDTTTVKIPPRKQAVDKSQSKGNNNNTDETDNTEKVLAATIDKPANISNGQHEEIAPPIETPIKEEAVTPTNNSSASEISTPMASTLRHKHIHDDRSWYTSTWRVLIIRFLQPPGTSEKIVRQEQVTRACVGAIAGAVLGVALSLIIRVINPILVSSLVVIVFYTMLGAIVGAAFGAFLKIRPLEERVFYYQGGKPRRTIVAVKTAEHQEEALNILYRHGASYTSIHDRLFY
jgi:hypothetical protein